MARGILSEYGPDANKPQAPRMSKNGPVDCGDVRNYKPPQGPMGMSHNSVGLGGSVHPCGTQGPSGAGGSTSGSVGLHGEDRGMGTNRKG